MNCLLKLSKLIVIVIVIAMMSQLSIHSYRLYSHTSSSSLLSKSTNLLRSTRSLYTIGVKNDIKSNNFNSQFQRNSKSTMMMASEERVFPSSFNVYKGKGAVSFKPIGPTFATYKQGPNKVVSREGTLLCEFAPAGLNPKEYDWTKKVSFALNLNECGEVLRLKEGSTIEFNHDPAMGSNDAGKMMKKMKWASTPDGKGMFLSISASDKSMAPFVLSVPISWGEVEVLKVLVAYCLPRFLALDRFFDTATSTNGPPASSSSIGLNNGYTQQQQNNGYVQQQQQQSSPPRQPFAQFSNQQPYSYN